MKLPSSIKLPSAPTPKPSRKASPSGPAALLLVAGGIAALLTFLLDPDQGKRRRNMLRDRVAAAVRRAGTQVDRTARLVAAEGQGLVKKVAHPRPVAREYDDVTLARKVESELFRGTGIPAGSVNVNVENGVVVLRGQVPRPEDIEELEQRARRIAGVFDVENLLHLPGTPARMS